MRQLLLVSLSLLLLAVPAEAKGPKKTPPGWSKGKKEGWDGDVPPGWSKWKGDRRQAHEKAVNRAVKRVRTRRAKRREHTAEGERLVRSMCNDGVDPDVAAEVVERCLDAGVNPSEVRGAMRKVARAKRERGCDVRQTGRSVVDHAKQGRRGRALDALADLEIDRRAKKRAHGKAAKNHERTSDRHERMSDRHERKADRAEANGRSGKAKMHERKANAHDRRADKHDKRSDRHEAKSQGKGRGKGKGKKE